MILFKIQATGFVMFSFRWKNKACIKRFDPKISSLSVCRIYDLYAKDVDVIFCGTNCRDSACFFLRKYFRNCINTFTVTAMAAICVLGCMCDLLSTHCKFLPLSFFWDLRFYLCFCTHTHLVRMYLHVQQPVPVSWGYLGDCTIYKVWVLEASGSDRSTSKEQRKLLT